MKYLNHLMILSSFLSFTLLISCDQTAKNGHTYSDASAQQADTTIHYPQEKHLANIKQLTDGGDNAEAYFSFDNRNDCFPGEKPGMECTLRPDLHLFFFRWRYVR